MSILCTFGLHKTETVRWGYDRLSGKIDWMIVKCGRGGCMWGKKKT